MCSGGANANKYCDGGSCVCKPGFTLCPVGGGQQACVDLKNNVNSCGACATNCALMGPAARCVDGQCASPPNGCAGIGQTNCNGACMTDAELAKSPIHCGACGKVCQSNEVCAQGVCLPYFTSPACDACPCAACLAGTSCCSYPGDTFPICVQGDVCPV